MITTAANQAMRAPTTAASVNEFEALSSATGARGPDPRVILISANVEDGLRLIIDSGVRVDSIVTSPPYYGQRDYGHPKQIGMELHPQLYIDRLVGVFQLCKTVLKDTGSLWINIGDTYWSGKGQSRGVDLKQSSRRFGIRPQDRSGDGKYTRPKQLLLIPHRLTVALQDDGWLVRNDNIWVKPNPTPDPVRDRCAGSHEHVFHLTQARWYFFDARAAGNPKDTWNVRPSTGPRASLAAFPEELVRIPILGSTPPRGIVLDPFNGSGTTTRCAQKHGFRSIGIDLCTSLNGDEH